jgi:hypothetical protein
MDANVARLFVFLVLFQIKHFLADYPFQTEYMLGKFKDAGWMEPLAFHAGVHAAMTMYLATVFGSHHIFFLGTIDFGIHFIMDRIKASPKLLGRFKALAASEFPQVKAEANKSGLVWTSPHWAKADAAEERLDGNRYFWWALGLDQMVHHLTHYLVLGLMVAGL